MRGREGENGQHFQVEEFIERVSKKEGGHRRYYVSDILRMTTKPAKEERKTIVYGRVSSHDQKQDLVRQVEVLSQFCSRQRLGI